MTVFRSKSIIFFGTTAIVWIYFLIVLSQRDIPQITADREAEKLSSIIEKLSIEVREEQREIERLKAAILRQSDFTWQSVRRSERNSAYSLWKEPIVVLVLACNRATQIGNLISKLISLRPSQELFPITISQDCNDVAVQRVVANFRDKVNYIKHRSADQERITIPKSHFTYTTYYYIARHYKLALEHVFDTLGYSTVILLEDDLDISDDFFQYFLATRYLLERDPKLWCVSAWNDNGKDGIIDLSANALLYRSDFFSGLGWMMTSKLWRELKPNWPAAFWDDWMREPEIRNGRQCIRPEISRTKMTPSGRIGASKGQFYEKHLSKVVLNTVPVSFTSMNLDYLLNPTYDNDFYRIVYNDSLCMSIDNLLNILTQNRNNNRSVRVEYTGNIDYIIKADKLHIMHDFKAGVPRTAYQGIVSCFINGTRIYLVPDRQQVKGYDKNWNVPSSFDM
ncbi:GNT-I family protein [Dictyocaulus viviparus]|uniref:Alpha-1,3-mannosyl-glycoprotein 2-beta-N-acetylglucosaminyltransferase n=1 Tax=Dictyocaulus viviparus TaxID=29172 RepID=A0A0D8XNG6_DICVI|nr:GNT-I family protein [Dictyocaulus viviparus]